MIEAAPLPIFRALHQSPLHGVPMDIAHGFDSMVLGVNQVVIVADLPELSGAEFARYGLLQHLHGDGQRLAFWFANQQVNVFRHDHEGDDVKAIPFTGGFKDMHELVTGDGGVEELSPAITGEGDEVQTMRVRVASEAARHDAGIVHQFLKSVVARACFIVPTLSAKNADKGGAWFLGRRLLVKGWATSQAAFLARILPPCGSRNKGERQGWGTGSAVVAERMGHQPVADYYGLKSIVATNSVPKSCD